MATVTMRSVDAGGPLVLADPAGDPRAACSHGVMVDTRFDAPAGAITLLLRSVERHDGTTRVATEHVAVTASLATAKCTPTDDGAAAFLADHAWIDDALVEHLDWMRRRVRRALAQRDRSSGRPNLMKELKADPSSMIPFDALYPADWDLLLQHEGTTYWAVDLHCPKPACPCTTVVVAFHRFDQTTVPQPVGRATLDLRHPNEPAKGTTPIARQLFAKTWMAYRDQLVRRHDEVRALVRGLPQHETSGVDSPPPRPVSRSGPCPCGSGKKYKRCCADRDGANAKVTAGE